MQFQWCANVLEKEEKKNVGKMPNVDVIYIDVVSTYKYWKFR